MTIKTIIQRKRIYIAVEGEGEQSFVKFLQQLSDQQNIHVHLDCEVLNGGGYKKMLERAVTYRSRREKTKGKAKKSILVVDTDRADKQNDEWPLDQLISEANKHNFNVCLQQPNLEGLLLRMFPGNERLTLTTSTVHSQLLRNWSDYKKPADSRMLTNKFSYDDLIRTAKSNSHLKDLLLEIGFLFK